MKKKLCPDIFRVQPYPLQCKGRFWLEPVKGKMNSPPAQTRPFAALDRTYPKSESAFEEFKDWSVILV